ncbi:M20/M25/M40 family metallo-hydrolase [Flavobacterium sp. PL11]|uniref:M20/M25/M40 family metallo-hydrolase n=1 Tax=Flavobacterium sp. PL11 TaxID=3071717 RepID=UPI002E129087
MSINKQEVIRIETELASDKMEGRATFSPGIELASSFIENEFKKIKLSFFDQLKNYRQEFDIKGKAANNVIGVLPGKSKPNEFVIFSAHYDHLGMAKEGVDKIYNGANDDASGTTAVIALAKYYKELNNNERTIIFIAFTAEEIGGFGSKFFSEKMNPDSVVAMFNIEMIGTESKWGKNSAYITGFEKTDFGPILQKNLKETNFNFYQDPYPTQQLFYRSDNARLAAQGVPAHTISTSKMDVEANYHKVSDEVSTLDLDNMTEIIKAIALSSQTIINGIDTPSRVKKR